MPKEGETVFGFEVRVVDSTIEGGTILTGSLKIEFGLKRQWWNFLGNVMMRLFRLRKILFMDKFRTYQKDTLFENFLATLVSLHNTQAELLNYAILTT